MLLLPFERIRFESSQSPDELIAALARVTRRPDPVSFRPLIQIPGKETATFVGEVSKERLYISRTTGYRNSFLPFVVGRVVAAPSGARIEAIMRPHVAVLVFLGVFALALGPAAIVAIGQFIQRGTFDRLEWLPLAMLAGLYAGCMLGFLPQANKTKRILREIAGPMAYRFGIST